jgi:4-diphosphocytidyl-2-C-methyl-D-erythritol kinase
VISASHLRVRSFAKINLALAVVGRLPDGFHEIRTVFQSIDLHDELEFRPSRRLELDGGDLKGVLREDNLIWKAAKALSEAARTRRGAQIILRKKIPLASGLGGGSSNAAVTLLGLCRLWDLEIPQATLISLAAGLGSDVPFFLQGGTMLGVGKGEETYPLPEIESRHLLVIFPGVHVSTADAYRSLRMVLTSREAIHKIQAFCGRLPAGPDLLAGIFNDFETSILPAYSAIREARDFLLAQRATAAMLSGSGSSVFGFFLDEESALAASRAVSRVGWRVFPAKTISRVEYFQRMFR